MKANRFPQISEELLKALEEYFPDRLPHIHDLKTISIEELIGQQNVLRFLRKKFEEQNKNILEGS